MRLLVVAGHGAGDPGAGGHGYNEAERVRALANRMKALGGNSVILGDQNVNWYASNRFSSVDKSTFDAAIELHMDAASASAKGGHVIIKSGFGADGYDNALANFIGGYFPGRSNKIVGRNDLQNVNVCASRGINYRLLEVCFISNADDISRFNSDIDAVARGILAAFGISGGSVKKDPWVNVQLYHSNSTHAQRWWREYTGKTKKINGKKCRQVMLKNVASGKYLDAYGAVAKNGTSVGVYPKNKTNAQLWWEEVYQEDAETYIVFHSCIDPKYVLDVTSASWDDGANVELFDRYEEGNVAQQFSYVFGGWPEGKLCYFIVNQVSGKPIDVFNGGQV